REQKADRAGLCRVESDGARASSIGDEEEAFTDSERGSTAVRAIRGATIANVRQWAAGVRRLSPTVDCEARDSESSIGISAGCVEKRAGRASESREACGSSGRPSVKQRRPQSEAVCSQ